MNNQLEFIVQKYKTEMTEKLIYSKETQKYEFKRKERKEEEDENR